MSSLYSEKEYKNNRNDKGDILIYIAFYFY